MHCRMSEKDRRQGRTPLMDAVKRGKEEIVLQLLSTTPSLVKERDNKGRTAVHYAIYRGKFDTVDNKC